MSTGLCEFTGCIYAVAVVILGFYVTHMLTMCIADFGLIKKRERI